MTDPKAKSSPSSTSSSIALRELLTVGGSAKGNRMAFTGERSQFNDLNCQLAGQCIVGSMVPTLQQ
eukprot:5828248-Amphidinium_carterae.1